MIMAAYIETGQGPQRDRIITSVDRDTYASFPDKVSPGPPTVYWFNHQVQPTITLWQPPDAAGPYTLKYYRARQMQDASLPYGLTPEVPFRFLEAYVAGLAFKLAELYAVDRIQGWLRAKTNSTGSKRDVEDRCCASCLRWPPIRIGVLMGGFAPKAMPALIRNAQPRSRSVTVAASCTITASWCGIPSTWGASSSALASWCVSRATTGLIRRCGLLCFRLIRCRFSIHALSWCISMRGVGRVSLSRCLMKA
jgi:hypothetical protein